MINTQHNVTICNPSDSLLNNTLPYITVPLKGESLYGYLLRLDIINNFSSGTILSYINKHNTGITTLNRPGLFLCGTIFDLHKLSMLTSIMHDKILDLTLVNTLKKVFDINSLYPELIGYTTHFKICPYCIKTSKLPLIHVFKNIDTCLEHDLMLLDTCSCGHRIVLFQQNNEYYKCPKCNTLYENLSTKNVKKNSSQYKKQLYLYSAYSSMIHQGINLIKNNEDRAKGFESRLQYISQSKNIKHGQFKDTFGYDASNLKNGLGLLNISLSKLLDMLYILGYSPKEFANIHLDTRTNKVVNAAPLININDEIHSCPNIYCEYFKKTDGENIKYYGKRTTKSGKVLVEEYCSSCATRFIGNNIIQSYDYNPGTRQYDIERAKERIRKWQNALRRVCEDRIVEKVPITLTGCFKKAKIPIGKTYFTKRLGLIDILIEYSDIQRSDLKNWASELNEKELIQFNKRIYAKKK